MGPSDDIIPVAVGGKGAAGALYYLIQSDGDDQMNRLALTLLAAKKKIECRDLRRVGG